jgi:DNA-binding transcriptional regulator YiaG
MMIQFDRALRNARRYVGETQSEFANRLKVSQPVLSRWERRRCTPSAPVRALIRRVLEEIWEDDKLDDGGA